jgi:hypothetical protein
MEDHTFMLANCKAFLPCRPKRRKSHEESPGLPIGRLPDKEITFSLRPLRLRGECKQFSALLYNRSDSVKCVGYFFLQLSLVLTLEEVYITTASP